MTDRLSNPTFVVMEWLFLLIGVLLIVGCGVAIYEWRHKKTILAHDLNLNGQQSETDREAERSAQALQQAHIRNNTGGFN